MGLQNRENQGEEKEEEMKYKLASADPTSAHRMASNPPTPGLPMA
jgi:hypothetical protein